MSVVTVAGRNISKPQIHGNFNRHGEELNDVSMIIGFSLLLSDWIADPSHSAKTCIS